MTKPLTLEQFKERATARHNGFYTYSKVSYINTKTKVVITCPHHSDFKQTPGDHMAGKGCAECKRTKIGNSKRSNLESVRSRCEQLHGDVYYIPNQSYTNQSHKLEVICSTHGSFQITAAHLLNRKQGCVKCGRARTVTAQTKSFSHFLSQLSAEKLSKFDYVESSFKSFTKSMLIRCKKHNLTFETKPHRHLHYNGCCPECKREEVGRAHKLSFSDFMIKVSARYGDSLSPVEESYSGSKDLMRVVCNKSTESTGLHGEFLKRPNDILNGHGCPKCSNNGGVSAPELEIKLFLTKVLKLECFHGYKSVLDDLLGTTNISKHLSLDIVIPKFKVAIEYNGVYWHSEKFKTKGYHLNKTEQLERAGWRLLHIWEDDWVSNKNLIKNRLRSLLGDVSTVYGRHTKVSEVSNAETKTFLLKHHIQGPGVSAKENYGLYKEGELLAVATFSKYRFGSDFDWELLRFCSKGRVVGGFSKLLKAFRLKHKGESLVTYADRSWGTGSVYSKCGFEFIKFTVPDYWWVKGGLRHNRQDFMKHKLKVKLKTFDSDKTEVENCRDNGYTRVFGCGNSKWGLIC